MKQFSFYLACLIFLIPTLSLKAQMPGGGRPGGGQAMNVGHFYGKVIDASTNRPIEAASVQLIQNKLDTTTKKRADVIVSGMLTTKKGEFSLENLPVMAQYKLVITAIGYKSIDQKAAFQMNPGGGKPGDMSNMMSAVDKDLGNIKMEADALQLEGVTVTADKPLLTMSIDRKIFNVEKNLTSAGGTGIDVMKNVPGVNVDIDGNVSLRNAPPQIFVDGRPTTMTLEQIPADAIATVEIITNPSAKFDASGGGAGILNIVLKKNRKAGYNGSVRASIDSRGRPGFGGDLNIKQQKINFFANTQVGFRKSISNATTDRTDFYSGTVAKLSQRNGPIGKGFFGFARMGFDYFIDNRNTISIAGSHARGEFKNTDMMDITRDTIYSTGTVSDYGKRNNNSEFRFKNYGGTLSFKHNFAKANKEITADLNYNLSKNDNNNLFSSQYFNSNSTPKTPLLFQSSFGNGTTKFFTAQTDYTNPINGTMKVEMGARIAIRDFNSFNNNFLRNPATGKDSSLTALNNNYQFQDRVLAAYGIFSQQIKKFSYQVGLRIESSKYDGTLVSRGQEFSNEFPFSLFPSAFATYKLTEKQDLQFNYSRKINRPNFFQLIPFIDFSDSLNLSIGNPDLVPEFTNLFELSYQNQLHKNHNILSTLYFKHTDDLITRYQYPEKNPNVGSKPDSILFTTYANASQSYTYGIELTGRNKLTKWWDLNTSFNLFNAVVKAGNLPGSMDNDQVSWFIKMNNSFKLPKNYSIQLSGDYQAKTLVTPGGGGGGRGGPGGGMFGGGNIPSAQGYIRPFYGVDIAIRKDFLKNNTASLTLQMSDVFRTRLNSTVTESIYFYQETERRRDPQVLRLNFNWRFGKFDVSLLKRKNMKGGQDSMEGMQGGQ
ncbi:MAG: outer membrane beta-barrel family protein [Ferruginibacter sp.]|nr:outer membrane beta-barrel family protein [Ferruginibacter sp.]